MSAAGRFITLEGGEGAGKSTQIGRLADRLRGRGINVITTREPGGSPGAEEIRRLFVTGEPDRWDGMTEALLVFAARRDHLRRTIWPALSAGKWVISDRFADSTMAYQGVARGLGKPVVEQLYRLTVGDFAPDLTLILDLPVADGLARASARAGHESRFESIDTSFHDRLAGAFRQIALAQPQRCRLIDARDDVDAVADRIWRQVAGRFDLAL